MYSHFVTNQKLFEISDVFANFRQLHTSGNTLSFRIVLIDSIAHKSTIFHFTQFDSVHGGRYKETAQPQKDIAHLRTGKKRYEVLRSAVANFNTVINGLLEVKTEIHNTTLEGE